MNPVLFKKFKFFKGAEILPKKDYKPAAPPKEEKTTIWQRVFENPFVLIFVFVAILSSLISYLPLKSLPVLKEGEIAPKDIIAPAELTIEDRDTTEKRKAEAEEAILPVYVFDPNVFLNTEEKIRQFFAMGREWRQSPGSPKKLEELQKMLIDKFGLEVNPEELQALARADFSSALEDILVSLLGKISNQGIILSKNLFIHREAERGFTLLHGPENERTARVSEILDIREAKELMAVEMARLDLSARNKALLTSLSDLFLAPNVSFNKVETEIRSKQSRDAVEPVFYTIKKGKVIIRKGDEVNAEALKQVRIINRNLRTKSSWLKNFIGTFLLFGLIFVALWFYFKSVLRIPTALKKFAVMGITFTLGLLAYKLSAFLAGDISEHLTFPLLGDQEIFYFAFPLQFGVLLFAFLTTNHIALVCAVLNGLLAGYFLNANFYVGIYSLIGGLAAIYGIKYYRRQMRTSTLRAGLFVVAPVNVFVLITFYLIREKMGGIDFLAVEIVMGLLGGMLSAALAFILLPVYETTFNFLTQTKLLELTNSDLPIFRQLALEAPGSYHHSLLVSSLAEKAAEEIKLDAMLVKAGALYHDIGKIKMPEYFIENTIKTPDIHKDLTPSMSTLVIINHVKEGAELAKRLKLPKKVSDIIEQHHGNSLVRYFYQKAREKYGPEIEKLGEENYRYPGPSPQSKEAALIMLADSVEAASRSLRNPTQDSLKRVITDIFNNYLQDGQLDDCDFSLKELRTIASSFLSVLYSIYHPRVEYPGFDFENIPEKKNKRANKVNDRNPQSTT